ncbi:hypothetical protein MMC14_010622 [Varicellaria rhodocarpa]|nr:hypothetical protein [Varicellaria rhodocarpa]
MPGRRTGAAAARPGRGRAEGTGAGGKRKAPHVLSTTQAIGSATSRQATSHSEHTMKSLRSSLEQQVPSAKLLYYCNVQQR